MSLRACRLACPIVAAAWLCAVAPSGCGSSGSRYPDSSVRFDAGPDQRTPPEPRPIPTVGLGSRLLVPGRATLIGSGADSCTSLTSSGDVWCGFARPSSFLGLTDLWVINVSKALDGADIKCNGGDPSCLLLTSTLAVGSSQLQPFALHTFAGDTLIYYASDDGNGSPGYAWRPGWPTGKLLALDAALGCGASKSAAVAYCLGNIKQDAAAMVVTTDIFAGAIGDGSMPLPQLGTAIVAVGVESDVTKFQIDLSPAGDWVAWSARPTANGLETLSAQKIGDATTRRVIAEDVSRWSIARDGRRWYWLKSYKTAGDPAGTLQMAAFPPPAVGTPITASTVMDGVATYGTAGDAGLLILHNYSAAGDLTMVPDRDDVAAATKLDSRVVTFMDISRDGKSALYSKLALPNGTDFVFDLHVSGVGRASPCTLSLDPLTPAGAGIGPVFSGSGNLAAWIKFKVTDDNQLEAVIGKLTDVAACTSQDFTEDLWTWSFVGVNAGAGGGAVTDEGLIWTENYGQNQSNVYDFTLKYGKLAGQRLPDITTDVQERANLTYASLTPAYAAVLYSIYVGTDSVDGLYVNAMLPFTSSHPSSTTDGGAGVADGAAPDGGSPADVAGMDAGAAGDAAAGG